MNTVEEEDRIVSGTDWRSRIRESKLGTSLVLLALTAMVVTSTYLINKPKNSGANVTSVTLSSKSGDPVRVGLPAQDFKATTVDGKEISLSSLKGHPVWLTFGASWCAACQAEAPDIEATYEKFKAQGVEVVSIFLSEDSKTVRDYGSVVGLHYIKIADPDTTISSAYRVLGIPTSFYIDSSGILRTVIVGSLNVKQMESSVKALMG
jgi:peroxiredoxin